MESWIEGGFAYWHWMVLGLILLGAEIFLSGFILFWFGLSALLLGLLMLLVPLSFKLQLLLWALFSVAMVFVFNRFIRPRWKNRSLSGMASEALFGQVGSVIQPNTGGSRGRLRFPAPLLGEDEWQFICETEVTIGTRVQVTELSGNTLIVKVLG